MATNVIAKFFIIIFFFLVFLTNTAQADFKSLFIKDLNQLIAQGYKSTKSAGTEHGYKLFSYYEMAIARNYKAIKGTDKLCDIIDSNTSVRYFIPTRTKEELKSFERFAKTQSDLNVLPCSLSKITIPTPTPTRRRPTPTPMPTPTPSPTPPPILYKWVDGDYIDYRARRICAISEDDDLYCKGSFPGNGHTSSADFVSTGLKAKKVVFARGSTCALTMESGVKCWGPNSNGTTGAGDIIPHLTPITPRGLGGGVSQISASYTFLCAIKDGSQVYCWGGGNLIQDIGNGARTSYIPVPVSHVLNAKDIDVGDRMACATTDEGLTCWGNRTPFSVIVDSSWLQVNGESRNYCYRVTSTRYLDCRSYLDSPLKTKLFALSANMICYISDTSTDIECNGSLGSYWSYNFGNVRAIINARFGHACAVNDQNQIACWDGRFNVRILKSSNTPMRSFSKVGWIDKNGILHLFY